MSEGGRLRVGVIGCGALGVIHARRFGKMADAQVVALSDPSADARQRAGDELPETPAISTEDYRELLGAGLDAVCIASPDGFHVAQVLDALSAGLHVLCEKPLTPDPEELKAVLAARDRAGRVVSLTYPRRYDAGVRALRHEMGSGRWGTVTAIAAYNSEDWITPNAGTWRHDPAVCPGGFFYDASGHQMDTLLWVTGLRAQTVRAECDCHGTRVPLAVWGTARLTGGVPLAFSFVGHAHRWREQVNIHCEGMDFALENGRALWSKDGKMSPIVEGKRGESADAAFVRLVRGEGPNWAPPDELWPVLEITRAALQSAQQGGATVSVQPGG